MARWGNCDYRQLKNLQKRLEQFNKLDRQKLCESLAKEIAARLVRAAVQRTPVDTGALKQSWREENKDFLIVKKDNVYEITIYNSMLYASYIEYGHRTRDGVGWVNGYFMLTISEQHIKRIAPALIEKRIMQKLGEVFG